MRESRPLLSIGIPVYNGDKYIRQTIDCLLGQTYENTELIISDNASTDGTEDICRSYTTKDNRVRYFRSPTNIGQTSNFERAFKLASADYFMWAACDDSWSPNYIGTLMDCLLGCPDATLAAGKTVFVNEKGTLLEKEPDDAPPQFSNSRLAVANQLLRQHAAGWLHGIYRREAIRKRLPTLVEKNPWGSDILFLLEICLDQTVTGSNTAVMFKRLASTNTSHGSVPRTPRQIVGWQSWYGWELIRIIILSPLPLRGKKALLQTCIAYLRRIYFWEGIEVWVKTWIRAGCHWVLGVDRR
jgi:glycosyltransferase involved in cell wall biosynthesis